MGEHAAIGLTTAVSALFIWSLGHWQIADLSAEDGCAICGSAIIVLAAFGALLATLFAAMWRLVCGGCGAVWRYGIIGVCRRILHGETS